MQGGKCTSIELGKALEWSGEEMQAFKAGSGVTQTAYQLLGATGWAQSLGWVPTTQLLRVSELLYFTVAWICIPVLPVRLSTFL